MVDISSSGVFQSIQSLAINFNLVHLDMLTVERKNVLNSKVMLTSSLYFDLWITTALEGTVVSGFRMLNSGFGRFCSWRFFHSSNVISWTTSSPGSPSAILRVYSCKVKTISLWNASEREVEYNLSENSYLNFCSTLNGSLFPHDGLPSL